MFGTNQIMKQDLDAEGRLWVQEIFTTIQGEGRYAGTPSVFIRLAGCNLNCKFCDTDFESAFNDAHNHMTLAAVLERVHLIKGLINNIVITGGEPFRQNIVPLCNELLEEGFTIEIETAGTLWIEGFEMIMCSPRVWLTVSPKTGKVNEHIGAFASAWKYIVRRGETNVVDALPDRLPCTGKPGLVARPMNNAPVYVQPCDDQNVMHNQDNTRAAIVAAMTCNYHLSIQVHKIIGVD